MQPRAHLTIRVTGKAAGQERSGKDFGHWSGTGTSMTFGSRVR